MRRHFLPLFSFFLLIVLILQLAAQSPASRSAESMPERVLLERDAEFDRMTAERGLEGFVNLIGIESPGLTASPAIARYVEGLFS